jgi:uncharacterized protein
VTGLLRHPATRHVVAEGVLELALRVDGSAGLAVAILLGAQQQCALAAQVTHHTTREYLDLLCGAYVVRQLQPWFENLGKRVVKSPKDYVRDSGLLHSLLGIPDFPALQGHPKLGASWEGFVIDQILSWAGERNAYFWATHSQAELDLMVLAKGKRRGFEVKYQDAPTITKSTRIAMQDLELERLWVIYPGQTGYPMDEKIERVSLSQLGKIRETLQ